MNVNELFRRLSYGELSNLSIGGEGSGTIKEDGRNRIINYANEALVRLYSRYVLRENDLIIQLEDYITSYHISCKFALTHEETPGLTRYIVDHEGDPYTGDFIKALTIYNSVGERLPLNDVGNSMSVFTPQPNTIQVPFPASGEVIGVNYQAKHAPLPYDNEESCIELPTVLEGALTALIAHKVFLNMNGQENSAKAVEYLATYEGICAEVTDRDLVNSSSSQTSEKFYERGFV